MSNQTKKTVLRYAGGKSRAIKKITPFIDPYSEIVSPFLGGGSLEVHWALKGKKVIASDVFDVLVCFWNQLLNNPNGLADELQKINPDKDTYAEIKEKLIQTPQVQKMLSHWKTDFYKREENSLEDVVLAAYYYFNHNCSYGPGFLGWASDIYMDQTKWDKTILKIRNFDVPDMTVYNESFETFIPKHKKSFMYLDPPYYLKKDEDNKMLGGIYPMKNIPVHHNEFDHEKLRDLLLAHEGDFVMSYNNCETIREWYKDFELFYPEWHYSMDVGEKRIGKNRKDRVNEEDLKDVDALTQMIENIEELIPDKNICSKTLQSASSILDNTLLNLKTLRHEIMKKESHEILIVKR